MARRRRARPPRCISSTCRWIRRPLRRAAGRGAHGSIRHQEGDGPHRDIPERQQRVGPDCRDPGVRIHGPGRGRGARWRPGEAGERLVPDGHGSAAGSGRDRRERRTMYEPAGSAYQTLQLNMRDKGPPPGRHRKSVGGPRARRARRRMPHRSVAADNRPMETHYRLLKHRALQPGAPVAPRR